MNKKKILYSLNFVTDYASTIECKDLHHKKAQQHAIDYICPAKYELDKHIKILNDYVSVTLKK